MLIIEFFTKDIATTLKEGCEAEIASRLVSEWCEIEEMVPLTQENFKRAIASTKRHIEEPEWLNNALRAAWEKTKR